MKIHIFSAEKASQHNPPRKTYTIRIYSGNPIGGTAYENLIYCPNYSFDTIKKYYFDDIKPTKEELEERFAEEPGEDLCPITSEIAEEILSDFRTHKDSIEELLVHCREGKSRSPAVAIALNDIFNLGENSEELRKKFPDMNSFVYETIMKSATNFK